MIAEVSKYDSVYPDCKLDDTTEYTGVYCTCGRCNFIKRKNLVLGDNSITCPICSYTAILVHNGVE